MNLDWKLPILFIDYTSSAKSVTGIQKCALFVFFLLTLLEKMSVKSLFASQFSMQYQCVWLSQFLVYLTEQGVFLLNKDCVLCHISIFFALKRASFSDSELQVFLLVFHNLKLLSIKGLITSFFDICTALLLLNERFVVN